MNNNTRIMREISPEWERLMRLATTVDYGEAKIIFNKGKPIRADFITKQIKLDNDEEFKQGLETIPLL